MKTPCELIVWNVVPVIKKEFAKILVNEFNLNQRQTAEKLQTTEAAISRYLSGKRGVFDIADKQILDEIRISCERIVKDDNHIFVDEICRVCRLIQEKQLFDDISKSC